VILVSARRPRRAWCPVRPRKTRARVTSFKGEADARQARRSSTTSSMLRRVPSLTVPAATSSSPCARGMPSSRARLRVTLPGVARAVAACAPSARPPRVGVGKALGEGAGATGGGAGARGGDAPLGGGGAACCALTWPTEESAKSPPPTAAAASPRSGQLSSWGF